MSHLFEIFYRFLILGFVSFGGPIAHLGYFRKTFVEKLHWLDDEGYSKLVALAQFLPGPSSSQVGFAIGLKRGGVWGAIFAFLGFTLPSFLLMYFLATLALESNQNEMVHGIIDGLKLFAVVVVADATFGMYKSFCKNRLTITLFIFATLILLIWQNSFTQIGVLLLAGLIGALWIKNPNPLHNEKAKIPNLIPFGLFVLLLFLPLFIFHTNEVLELFSSFYSIGSLVFGGGHVVLPLIGDTIKMDENSFLVGYSFAQIVPGPMFSIAAYFGAKGLEATPLLGAFVATIALFLPGLLLILAFSDSFESYSSKPIIASALIGVNASVVALLFSALLSPIIPSSVTNIIDVLFVVVVFVAMQKYKIPIFYLIFISILYGVFL